MTDPTGDIRTEPDKEQTWLDCCRRAGSEPRGGRRTGRGRIEEGSEGVPDDSHAGSDHAPTFGRGGKGRRHRHDGRPGGKKWRARLSPAKAAGGGPVAYCSASPHVWKGAGVCHISLSVLRWNFPLLSASTYIHLLSQSGTGDLDAMRSELQPKCRFRTDAGIAGWYTSVCVSRLLRRFVLLTLPGVNGRTYEPALIAVP